VYILIKGGMQIMKLTAYKCLECGHYTISKHDGARCAECDGVVAPVGNATCIDKNKGLKVEVSIKDTKLFNTMLSVFKALIDDKHTPDWIKEKIQRLVLNEIKKD